MKLKLMKGCGFKVAGACIVVGFLNLTGCDHVHSYEGDVGYKNVTLHFRPDQTIDQLWERCDGETNVQAFAIRRDNGACEIWLEPPSSQDDAHFMRILYHELGHCEEASFGLTHTIEPDCAEEK